MTLPRSTALSKHHRRPSPSYACWGRENFETSEGYILDVMPVTIGSRTQIGPAVQIYAADHPRDAAERRSGLELGKPVLIGENVWIGGGAIILPGVVIGDDAIIGAGQCNARCAYRLHYCWHSCTQLYKTLNRSS